MEKSDTDSSIETEVKKKKAISFRRYLHNIYSTYTTNQFSNQFYTYKKDITFCSLAYYYNIANDNLFY